MNLVPAQYREVSVAEVPVPLEEDALRAYPGGFHVGGGINEESAPAWLERGASAVEYGLLVAGIAALIVAVVFAFGGVINDVFSTTCNSVAGGAGTTGC